jgi:hypothetical protein
MSMINRLGSFFIWIGAGSMMIFILSDRAQTPVPALLLGGLVCIGFGIFLWRRGPREPNQPSRRFRMLKKRATDREQAQGSRRRQNRASEAEPPSPTRKE